MKSPRACFLAQQAFFLATLQGLLSNLASYPTAIGSYPNYEIKFMQRKVEAPRISMESHSTRISMKKVLLGLDNLNLDNLEQIMRPKVAALEF